MLIRLWFASKEVLVYIMKEVYYVIGCFFSYIKILFTTLLYPGQYEYFISLSRLPN